MLSFISEDLLAEQKHIYTEGYVLQYSYKVSLKSKYFSFIFGFVSRSNMSDLAWAVKNGDMDQVKDLVEGKVADSFRMMPFFITYNLK